MSDHMQHLCLVLLLGAVALTSCNVDENPLPVQNLFFGCYDPDSFGELNPNRADGLPESCAVELLADDFTDSNLDWYVGTQTNSRFTILRGQYNGSTQDVNFWATLPEDSQLDQNQDYEVRLDLRFESTGNNELSNGGLIFGTGYNGIRGEAFAFTIQRSGRFRVERVVDSELQTPIIGYTQTSAISLQSGAVNQLLVRQWAGRFYFFINDELVAESVSIPTNGFRTGARVGSFSNVTFDNFLLQSYVGL